MYAQQSAVLPLKDRNVAIGYQQYTLHDHESKTTMLKKLIILI